MGYSSYSTSDRALRSSKLNYSTASVDTIFTQQKEHKVHEDMDSKKIGIRECLDSTIHPNTYPIIMGLDLTGSMGHIPHELIKEGLPKLMGSIIQKGVEDASLCFVGVGDHEVDRYPLQAAQFESGDAELDMWLTRTFLEGGGGGNAGESYLLAWYFAAYHTKIDSFDKRGVKGLLVTIGDEPNLKNLPASAVSKIMGGNLGQTNYTAEELLKEAQKRWNVYHINITHGYRNDYAGWKQALGDHAIDCTDYKKVPEIVADLVIKLAPKSGGGIIGSGKLLEEIGHKENVTDSLPTKSEEIIL